MESNTRHYIRIKGVVQGIGFRPFIYKLAIEMNLKGWVNNDTEGVNIVVDCSAPLLNEFTGRIRSEKPALARIDKIDVHSFVPHDAAFSDFSIHESEHTANNSADVLPDLATCTECVREINDPTNRRYQYLFTNCTYCGPRFSIMEGLPYDRVKTTMADFIQCKSCLQEYQNPLDRRFHAQPNACATCGPQISLVDDQLEELERGFRALETAVALLKNGKIIALKGIGGYQLLADANNSAAVSELRRRKKRGSKPFAVMMKNLEEVKGYCEVNETEKAQLESVAAPIVLLKSKIVQSPLAFELAPNNPYLGVFLPNTPMHHWLLRLFSGPLVVTSANLSDEPLVFTEPEVFDRLKGLADAFVVHDRRIARPIDDSVVQVVNDRVFVLRSARGLAPVQLPSPGGAEAFATGPHMKSSFAFQFGKKIVLSQHLGDLESEKTQELFQNEYGNYSQFYNLNPQEIICDSHPGYFTSEWAEAQQNHLQKKVQHCQHHRAHIFATLVENEFDGSLLGISWDGTGYGDDGSIWGGEFFQRPARGADLKRVASLRPFFLLGGEAAIRSPWRVALALLFEVNPQLAKAWFLKAQTKNVESDFQFLQSMWQKKINSVPCTSMGRFLEGVAALLGISFENHFDAEAAMMLEFAAQGAGSVVTVGMPWVKTPTLYEWDWRAWIQSAAESFLDGVPPHEKASEIHQLLIHGALALAEHLGETTLAVGGGVFQNRLLMGGLLTEGANKNFTILVPSRVPINDGGVAIGQLKSSQ